MTVLRGDDLRARGIRFVGDALRQVPGAQVVQGGPFGAPTSLFLRGGESDYVKVLVDGVPVNQPGGSYDFASLTTDNVERIEVLRGPGSVLYGSDAIAGVVQIVTRQGRERDPAGRHRRGGKLRHRAAGGLRAGRRRGGRLVGLGSRGSPATAPTPSTTTTATPGSPAGSVRVPTTAPSVALRGRWYDAVFHFPTDFIGAPVDHDQSHRRAAPSRWRWTLDDSPPPWRPSCCSAGAT